MARKEGVVVRGQGSRCEGPRSVLQHRRPSLPPWSPSPSFSLTELARPSGHWSATPRAQGSALETPSETTFAARYQQAAEGPTGYPSPPSPPTDLARSTAYGARMPAYNAALGADGHGPASLSLARPAAVPTEVLLHELPDMTAGSLIPLAEVVDACVNEIYKRLVELQDVLPSRHEKARARDVFQFALWARRECVRLLAVVRWCREGPAVTKALVRPASSPRHAPPTRRCDSLST